MFEKEELNESETGDVNEYLLLSTPTEKKSKEKLKKPKVVSEWLEHDVFKLIACVEEYPALWDARDSQYRNKHERTKLWDTISEKDFQSKFAGAELLAKWSNIRIQFRSYANRQPKSGAAATPPINWKYYSAMRFIGHAEYEQTAPTESNLILPHENENSTGSVGSTPPPNNIAVLQHSRKRYSATSTASSSATSNSSAATIVAESMRAAVVTLNQSKQQTCDEFDTFGKYLSSELRSLDNITMARRLKRKINRFFLDAVDQENIENVTDKP